MLNFGCCGRLRWAWTFLCFDFVGVWLFRVFDGDFVWLVGF